MSQQEKRAQEVDDRTCKNLHESENIEARDDVAILRKKQKNLNSSLNNLRSHID